MASQSQSPLPPLATAAAAAAWEEVRLWDKDWAIPGSVDVGLEDGLGLKENKGRECYHKMDRKWDMDGHWEEKKNGIR